MHNRLIIKNLSQSPYISRDFPLFSSNPFPSYQFLDIAKYEVFHITLSTLSTSYFIDYVFQSVVFTKYVTLRRELCLRRLRRKWTSGNSD